jgi:long-subunit fatty acid transport protein
LVWLAPVAWAQVDINSTPNFVGSGARALGMGGAFIAVADDATAASWNPGGLTQLERPEFSAVYSWKWFRESFPDTFNVSTPGPYELNLDEINYLSFVYPIPWTLAGRNFVVSLNYQRKYNFDRKIDFRARVLGQDSSPVLRLLSFSGYDIRYEQEGDLSAISPAFGFEIFDWLSAGVALNIWDSSLVPGNGWETKTLRRGVFNNFMSFTRGGSMSSLGIGTANTFEEYDDVEGINYTFGLLYKPTERLSVGAVYHTAYHTDVDYKRLLRMGNPSGVQFYHSNLRIEWPSALGVGLAYRFPNDKLTLSLDVTRRNWDSFVEIDSRQGMNDRTSPITGMPKWQSQHDPTYTVRLGGEYVFVDASKPSQKLLPSLRAGVYYDPAPASGRKNAWWGSRRGNGDPDDYYGATLGAGVLVYNRVNVDAAYEYRWASDARRDTLAGGNAFGFPGRLERSFDADVGQHIFSLSTVVYF